MAANSLPEYLSDYIVVAQKVSLEASGADKVVAVPEFIFDIDCCNDLFIRQEYLDVAHIIQKILTLNDSIRRVLVLGSPGIGKSVFGVLLFLLAIKKKKDVAYHPLNDAFTYYFTWNGTEYKISDFPHAGKTYEAYFDRTNTEVH